MKHFVHHTHFLKSISLLIKKAIFYYIDNAIAFWMKDGTHILICEYKKGCYSITLIGNIIFEGVKITDSILNYIEMKDTLDNCVKKGIELLMEHNR